MTPVDSSVVTPKERRKVLEALEDDRYVWRTIEGIVKDTGLPETTVENAVLWDPEVDTITRSDPDNKGRTLFTTRSHYQKKRSLGWRVLCAIAGKTA